jgi:hypothetical protein
MPGDCFAWTEAEQHALGEMDFDALGKMNTGMADEEFWRG